MMAMNSDKLQAYVIIWLNKVGKLGERQEVVESQERK